MKMNDLLKNNNFKINYYNGTNSIINKIICSDLHGYALSKLNENDVWITIVSHINTLAVAKQKNIACIIIADGIKPSNEILKIAEEHKITILTSTYPVYETALIIRKIEESKC